LIELCLQAAGRPFSIGRVGRVTWAMALAGRFALVYFELYAPVILVSLGYL
jgi:hypothetical protein